tara:strand:+ start:1854 stop:2138 length:285 start_codon:yes stop_codon:yes gene_type:complete
MKPIETAVILASCLAPQTGSTKVFVNNLGVSRVMVDGTVDGGIIKGPGSSKVFVEGAPASLQGDMITPHPPCPLIPSHCVVMVNKAGQPKVICG